MSKRKVDGSSHDDEKPDFVMTEAASMSTEATAAATASSEGERHSKDRDYSSLFRDNAVDASLRQSYLSILKKAYELAKNPQQDWDDFSRTKKIGLIARVKIPPSVPEGEHFYTKNWFIDKMDDFLDIHEEKDMVDHGPTIDRGLAENAFELGYTSHPDDNAFLEHLETQRTTFLERKETGKTKNAPFFAVVQSSGYGKSRLISQVSKHIDYDVIYWSFASEAAYPPKNITIDEASFKGRRREALEMAFETAIGVDVEGVLDGKEKQMDSVRVIAPLRTTNSPDTKPPAMQQHQANI